MDGMGWDGVECVGEGWDGERAMGSEKRVEAEGVGFERELK